MDEPVLPPSIAAYFTAPNDLQPSELGAIFAIDAKVHDEKRDHEGLEQIAAWRREAYRTTHFTAVPLTLRSEGDTQIVAAEVSGDFPGSPITLDHRFKVTNGLIQSLKIG